MITIGVPAEGPDEPRIGLSPETAKKLVKLGAKVLIRSGAGLRSHFSDQEYKDAGAEIVGPTPTRSRTPTSCSPCAGRRSISSSR